jgi:eukaryotic-like serine/threonine-protein kinase
MQAELPDRIGPFNIEAVLGRGAMSVVFRGHAEGERRTAAVKVLRAEILAEAERDITIARFLREAELCRLLDHPNVVKVFESGAHQGNPYLAMELLEGQSLADILRGPVLEPAEALRLSIALLEALGHVHAHSIVHRDIKPANMVVRPDGTLVLVDFGIAHQGGSDITQVGDMLGSPAYMSPEQLSGRSVDARADLFAAGIVLYALLTRQRPFSGTVASVMQAILNETPLPPSHHRPDLPPALDAIMARALAKEPGARYQSAASFAADLRPLVARALSAKPAAPHAVDPASPARTDAGLTAAAFPTAFDAMLSKAEDAQIDAAQLLLLEKAEANWPALASAARAGFDAMMETLPARLERLIATIIDTAPVPEAQRPVRGDWMALVRLAAVGLRLLHRLGHTEIARTHHRRLSDELAEPFIIYVDIVGQFLATGDNPDLDRLSMGLLRLDVLEMALEAISAPAELRLARKTRLLVAIQAMRRVNATVSHYTRTGDMIARFDVAMLMSEIEALIAIAARLTDDGAVPPGRLLGETAQSVIRDFIAGARDLVTLTVEDLGQTEFPAGARAFAAKLRQLRALYRFAVLLPGQTHRNQMRSLADTTRSQVEGLARALMLRENTGDALSEIFDLAEALGWQALAAEILSHLNSR